MGGYNLFSFLIVRWSSSHCSSKSIKNKHLEEQPRQLLIALFFSRSKINQAKNLTHLVLKKKKMIFSMQNVLSKILKNTYFFFYAKRTSPIFLFQRKPWVLFEGWPRLQRATACPSFQHSCHLSPSLRTFSVYKQICKVLSQLNKEESVSHLI